MVAVDDCTCACVLKWVSVCVRERKCVRSLKSVQKKRLTALMNKVCYRRVRNCTKKERDKERHRNREVSSNNKMRSNSLKLFLSSSITK